MPARCSATRPARPVTVLNDADAAGMAEMEFGAGKGAADMVIMITLGTGIGSAVFIDGTSCPTPSSVTSRSGQGGRRARRRRERARVGAAVVEEVGGAAGRVLPVLEALFWPDLIIVGGGVSKKSDKFLPLISTRVEIVPAQLLNEAGIVGAAVAASRARRPAAGLDGAGRREPRPRPVPPLDRPAPPDRGPARR